MRHAFLFIVATLAAAILSPIRATQVAGFAVNVLMNDTPRPEFRHDGTVYVEAVRGREFSIRLTNPTPNRVAVALSVDGLNTIDAQHTDAWSASKWVLGPYESTVISGWQVNQGTARRFYFTGEKHSYGAALGQTDNLGVIEAVFFVERPRYVEPHPIGIDQPKSEGARKQSAAAQAPSAAGGLSDDYAATGMGHRTSHEVESVDIDLDPHPIASARIRYEFRPELVRLGILYDEPSPIDRREHARGFERYCPEPANR